MNIDELPQGSKILVVDDDDVFRSRLCQAFAQRGFSTIEATSAAAAIKNAAEMPDCAVVDLRLAERSGLEVIQAIRLTSPKTKVVMLTGYGSISTALEAVRLGACNYLSKPADADEILAALHSEQPPRGHVAAGKAAKSAPSLARAEWEHIQRILGDCGGNITRAAEILGIPRRSLQRKLGKYPPRT